MEYQNWLIWTKETWDVMKYKDALTFDKLKIAYQQAIEKKIP